MSPKKKSPQRGPDLSTPASSAVPQRSRYSWLVVALVAGLALWVRVRLSAMPLERDEGEFAYMGQLILKGVPPYSLAYSMKLPGIYLAYALILSLFGQSASGVHLGFALVHVATIALVFMLCSRLFDDWAGTVAAAAYAAMTLSPSVQGTSAHATHFVVLPALGGLLLLAFALGRKTPGKEVGRLESGRGHYAAIGGAGVLLGIAFLMKQPGVLFLLCGVIWVLLHGRARLKIGLTRAALLLLGAAVPVGLVGVWLVAAGVFEQAWFWVFTYASTYASEVPLQDAGIRFIKTFVPVYQAAPVVWLLAAVGVTLPLWSRASRAQGILLLILATCSVVAASLSFNFRPHYFVLALPAVAMLAGAATTGLRRVLQHVVGNRLAALLALSPAALAVVMALNRERDFLFGMSPESACRHLYGSNPFPESETIADYIKRHSGPTDRVVVIGSEPQIYFYADRLSATGHIYMYGLMEDQPHALAMQQEMIREVESAQPKFVVFVTASTSWLRRPTSRSEILQWTTRYLQSGHRLVGCVEPPSADSREARYYWGAAAADHRSQAQNRVLVYEREGSGATD